MKTKETKKYKIYGVIGMVALVFVGVVIGYVLNGSDHINRSTMSRQDCQNIARKIIDASGNSWGEGANPSLIEQLNKVYSANCVDRVFEQPKPQPKVIEKKLPETTCGKIEILLKDQIRKADSMDAEDHIDNAKLYANLSERGCAENSQKYKDLAKQELEIARALNDDNLRHEDESIEIVETYKRLQMQHEAEKMIEKAKKLTNPAIDFIIQLEKIIEE